MAERGFIWKEALKECIVVVSLKRLLGLFVVFFMMASTSYASGLYFTQGDRGSDVALLQTKLKERGFYSGRVDGIFSGRTSDAVKSFQRTHRLKADGVVDRETYHLLTGQAYSQPAAKAQTKKIIAFAKKQLKVPYVFGGTTPKGFDCSGFTQFVFRNSGRQLPRMADEQFKMGKAVGKNDLQEGDLVFFTTYEKGASHTGIYLGQGQFIHASTSKGVMISRLDETYWKKQYLGAKRVL